VTDGLGQIIDYARCLFSCLVVFSIYIHDLSPVKIMSALIACHAPGHGSHFMQPLCHRMAFASLHEIRKSSPSDALMTTALLRFSVR
jgi:hypothetical protein